MDTNLITQSVIGGLQTQIDVIQNNLIVANANLASVQNTLQANLAADYSSLAYQLAVASSTLTSLLNSYNVTLLGSLNTHIATTYALAHGGLAGSLQNYNNAANILTGDHVVAVVINGITYYIPASLRPDGVYVPPPPPPPPPCSDCGGNCCDSNCDWF